MAAQKQNGCEQVNEYMDLLVHPLKAEIQAVIDVILNADDRIAERVKWNAPSFYYKLSQSEAIGVLGPDLLTIHVKALKHVHIIFHHAEIVNVSSAFLEGDYKDRRMLYLQNMEAVEEKKEELTAIVRKLMQLIGNKLK